jgi:hypothetical protein
VARSIAALAVGLLALGGCETAWDWANRDALARDVEELLQRHGVTARDPSCRMVGTSRTGACLLRVRPDAIPGLLSGLALRPAAPDDVASRAWGAERGCRAFERFQAAAPAFRSERRAPELRLPNGGAFEYLLLFPRAESDEVCVQVSYAYG